MIQEVKGDKDVGLRIAFDDSSGQPKVSVWADKGADLQRVMKALMDCFPHAVATILPKGKREQDLPFFTVHSEGASPTVELVLKNMVNKGIFNPGQMQAALETSKPDGSAQPQLE